MMGVDRDDCSDKTKEYWSPPDHVGDAGETPSSLSGSPQSQSSSFRTVVTYAETEAITHYSCPQIGTIVQFPISSSAEAASTQQGIPTIAPQVKICHSSSARFTYDPSWIFTDQQSCDPTPTVPLMSDLRLQALHLEDPQFEPSATPQTWIDPQASTVNNGFSTSSTGPYLNIAYTRCAPDPFCGLCTECSLREHQG
jgi:hypothetical protein